MTHVDPAACVICQLLNGRLGSPRVAPTGMWLAKKNRFPAPKKIQEGQTHSVGLLHVPYSLGKRLRFVYNKY